jgi:hypothetical protein
LVSSAQAMATRTISRGVSTHSRAQEMVVIGSVVVEPTGALRPRRSVGNGAPDLSDFHIIAPMAAIRAGMMQGQRGGSCCIRPVGLVVSEASGVIVRGFAFGGGSG